MSCIFMFVNFMSVIFSAPFEMTLPVTQIPYTDFSVKDRRSAYEAVTAQ